MLPVNHVKLKWQTGAYCYALLEGLYNSGTITHSIVVSKPNSIRISSMYARLRRHKIPSDLSQKSWRSNILTSIYSNQINKIAFLIRQLIEQQSISMFSIKKTLYSFSIIGTIQPFCLILSLKVRGIETLI